MLTQALTYARLRLLVQRCFHSVGLHFPQCTGEALTGHAQRLLRLEEGPPLVAAVALLTSHSREALLNYYCPSFLFVLFANKR